VANLSPRQAAFCRLMLEPGTTATEAARKAGYSPSYADRQATQLLGNPRVAAYLAELRASLAAPALATAEEILTRLWDIARGEVRTEKATRQGVVELPPDFGERTRALELIGKHLGMFTDRSEVTLKRDPRGMSKTELEEYLRGRGLLE